METKPDIIEFAESTLGLKLTEFQKEVLRTCYEHKDEMTGPLYLNVGRSQKKVIVKELQVLLQIMKQPQNISEEDACKIGGHTGYVLSKEEIEKVMEEKR